MQDRGTENISQQVGSCRILPKSMASLHLGNWLGFQFSSCWEGSLIRKLLVTAKISVLLMYPWSYCVMLIIAVIQGHDSWVKAGGCFPPLKAYVVLSGTMKVSPQKEVFRSVPVQYSTSQNSFQIFTGCVCWHKTLQLGTRPFYLFKILGNI